MRINVCKVIRLIAFLALIALAPGCAFRVPAASPESIEKSEHHPLIAESTPAPRWPPRYAEPFTADVCTEQWWQRSTPVPPPRGPSALKPPLRADLAGPPVNLGLYDLGPASVELTELPLDGPTRIPLPYGHSVTAARWLLARTWMLPPPFELDHNAEDYIALNQRIWLEQEGWPDQIVDLAVRTTEIFIVGEPSPDSRGTALYLAGIDGLIVDAPIVRALAQGGWMVIVIQVPRPGAELDRKQEFSAPFWNPPQLDGLIRRGLRPELLRAADRLDVRPRPRPRPDDLGESAARAVARSTDEIVAERAYVAQAVLGWGRQAGIVQQSSPYVIIGASLGAISTPAVVMRTARPDAVVLIGGGMDVGKITEIGFRTRALPGDPPTSPSFGAEYRRTVTLDPVHTASALEGVPVLQIHAQFDSIVHASTGRALWERLGRPERWDYPVGHIGLFLLSGVYAEDVVRWLWRAVDPATP